MASTASEFSNNKFRDFNVGLVQAGWPVGAIFTGFFCAYAIPQFGWRFAFLIAGCISTLMLVVVLVFMRDSFGFLLRIQPKNAIQKINKLLVKLKQDTIQLLPEKPVENNNETYKMLFTNEFKDSTIKLWTAVFFGFLTLYTLMSWVPNIAKEAGLPFEMATYVGVSLNIGAAIGTISVGVFASKFGLKRTVFIYMLLAFFVMLIYGNITLTNTLIFIVILSIGLFVQGGFNGLYPILSRVYPTEIRSTGVGYAVGIGRVGAILGPTLFGLLSDNGLSTTLLFSLFSLPLLITGLCVKKLNSQNLS
jgi:MFS family permease